MLDLHDPAALPSDSHVGLDVTSGIMKDEAIEILKRFYASGNPNAPDEKRKRPLVLKREEEKVEGGKEKKKRPYKNATTDSDS